MSDEGKQWDEVEQLVWSLVDGAATAEQITRLEQLLKNDARAREIYTRCMQLHTDLHSFFFQQEETPSGSNNPPAPPLPGGTLPIIGEFGTSTSDSA